MTSEQDGAAGPRGDMSVIRSSSVVLFFLLALNAGAQSTIAERSFSALRQHPPVCRDRFDFVVVGDTRSSEPVVLPEVFYQMIGEWNVLSPAFVVDVGDLILGGAAEGLDPQWLAFEQAVGQCEAPFFPVAGNHDVSDPATERIYEERVGPLLYAFSYGNSRFILLNSEEQGAVERLSGAQVIWLEEDLAACKADNIFLFLHRPYFNGDWDAQWSNVAEALRGYPVRVVFGGHYHLYRDCGEREGVRYAITGGGGAERHGTEEEGAFEHYLRVSVRGEEVQWAVVKPGAILPADVVTKARLEEGRALNASFRTESIEVPFGEGLDCLVSVFVENPYDTPLASTLTWKAPAGWRVEPGEMAYEAQAQAQTTLTFRVQAEGPARFPVPEFSTTLKIAPYGEPITVTKPVELVPLAGCAYAVAPVTADGKLPEWDGATILPLDYAYDFDIADTEDLKAAVRLMWDEGHLYVAVEAEDDEFYQPYAGDIVWSADNVQLFLDEWEWSLTLTSRGEEVFLYEGPGRESETVNTAVALAVRRDGKRIVIEAVFPASEVTPLRLHEGSSFMFSAVLNDLDPSVAERPRHWAELTPGAGSGGPFPRAKVVLEK